VNHYCSQVESRNTTCTEVLLNI